MTKLSQRKKEHIDLALKSQANMSEKDPRFYYEPLLSPHPVNSVDSFQPSSFLGKSMRFPLWISSMTGGTEHEISKIHLFSLTPHPGTMLSDMPIPSKEYHAWWISQLRIAFPKLDIQCGIWAG
jgi:isopentenyl diphosphate isomerase/L-lactate dehydrogenase-like FMN-dependent dehydrogenase